MPGKVICEGKERNNGEYNNGIVEVKMMWNESWYCFDWIEKQTPADATVTLSAINAGPGRAADSEWWREICDHTSADDARWKLSVCSTQQKQRRASAAAIITLFLPSTPGYRLQRVIMIRIETWSFKRRPPTADPTDADEYFFETICVCVCV